jgi:hypothetical protein
MITQALGIRKNWEFIKGTWSQNSTHPPIIAVMVIFVVVFMHFNIE